MTSLTPFAHFVQTPRAGRKFICHCYEEVPKVDLYDTLRAMPPHDEVTVLVGPEGDCSVDEVRLAMAHGNSRLRTETAGLMAVTMAQLSKRL